MSVLSNAPIITEEEERAEREALTEEENRQLQQDVYGLLAGESSQFQGKTASDVEQAVAALKVRIESMPERVTREYNRALSVAPDVVAQESAPLSFLRCEEFNIEAAATRLVTYWKLRCQAFANDEERAFLPLRLNDSLRDDFQVLENAIFLILPKDLHGRQVLFMNLVSGGFESLTHDAICRAFLLVSLRMMADETAAASGFVALHNMQVCASYTGTFTPSIIKISHIPLLYCRNAVFGP